MAIKKNLNNTKDNDTKAKTPKEAKDVEEKEESLSIEDVDNDSPKEDLEQVDWKPLIEQIEKEYRLAWDYMKPKWDEWEIRLRLYNNQKRDKEAIGDPLLFTIHQSVLASLYSDTLIATWEAREEGDDERAELLNSLSEFDHGEMEKDVLDYEWDWDTTFFGRGYQLLWEFDRDLKVPVGETLDPMVCLPDPFATTIQGDRKGRGKAGYFGWEARMTALEMDENENFFNLEGLKSGANANKLRSVFDRNHDARNAAQGTDDVSNLSNSLTGDNQGFRLLNWFTYWGGELVFVTLAEDRKKVVRFYRLRNKDDEPIKEIPIIDRVLFPISHQLHGVSIPDLVEDKQRARSVLQNVALRSAKNNVYPRYLFNSNKIKNRHDLDIAFNKHIPVEGDPNNAIVPVQKDTVKQEVQFILDLLDGAAQRSTGVPEFQQGSMSEQGRTATELNIVASRVDKRFSLAAKIFGWSERRFWQQWYKLYKDNFVEDIDEKVIRVHGALGAQWLKLTRENIVADIDPDVTVKSKLVADSERMEEMQLFQNYIGVIAADPNANVRYAFKELGRLHGLRKDKIDRMLPPTFDELRAEEENDRLAEDEKAYVHPIDNDDQHLQVHNRAPDTPAKLAHLNAHKRSMMLKKMRPELFAEQENTMNPTAGEVEEPLPQMQAGNGVNRGGNRPTRRPELLEGAGGRQQAGRRPPNNQQE